MDRDNIVPPTPDQEVGSIRLVDLPEYFGTDDTQAQAETIQKMLREDAVARMLLSVVTLAISSASGSVIPPDDEPASVEQAELVNNWLKAPYYEGGMTTGFDTFFDQCLLAAAYGYSAFEKVWQINPENYLTYRKIAYRPPLTIKRLKQDERGGFDGILQSANVGGTEADVDIPVERAFVYTRLKEENNLYGVSALAIAYRYYNLKRRWLFMMQQAGQRDSFDIFRVDPRVPKDVLPGSGGGMGNTYRAPNAPTTEQLKALGEELQKQKSSMAVIVPENRTFERLVNSRPDFITVLNWLNAEMARSALAGFVLLGQTGSPGTGSGSWALSKDQSEFFLNGLQKDGRGLETHITNWIVADLYIHNFPDPRFGRFKIPDLSDEKSKFLREVFLALIGGEVLTEEYANSITEEANNLMGLPVNLEKYFDRGSATGPGEPDNDEPDESEPEDEPDDDE